MGRLDLPQCGHLFRDREIIERLGAEVMHGVALRADEVVVALHVGVVSALAEHHLCLADEALVFEGGERAVHGIP